MSEHSFNLLYSVVYFGFTSAKVFMKYELNSKAFVIVISFDL